MSGLRFIPTPRRRAFTLLEALVAITIFAGVIGACLMLRSQTIAQGARIETRLERERIAWHALDSAMAGVPLVGARARGDGPDRVTIWEGTLLGRPFRVERRVELVRAPRVPPSAGQSAQPTGEEEQPFVLVHRYAAECEGVEIIELRPAVGG